MARIHQRATGGRLPPDVVLMDLRMPEVDGVEATARIRTERPDVRVVVLTTCADDESVFAALRAGARGYLTKDAGSEEIARAIALVAAGEAMLDPAVQVRLLDRLDAAAAFEPPAFSAQTSRGSQRGRSRSSPSLPADSPTLRSPSTWSSVSRR